MTSVVSYLNRCPLFGDSRYRGNCDGRPVKNLILRYEAKRVGDRLVVLIGDVRRGGKYTPIVKDVLNFPMGEIRSIIIKVQHNCTSDRNRYGKLEDVPIKHEYCVIFKKPVVRTW